MLNAKTGLCFFDRRIERSYIEDMKKNKDPWFWNTKAAIITFIVLLFAPVLPYIIGFLIVLSAGV